MLAPVTDSPVPDAPDDFDDQTEVVGGVAWTAKPSEASTRQPAVAAPSAEELMEGGWDEEEATAVVSATDIGGFFGDRFRVDARLGIGAMGRVLTAVDMKTGTLVALKVLHKDRSKDPAVVERFQREAAVLREIRHPAIVRLVAFDRARDGTWWLAMEHLVGKTLKDRLSHGGPFMPRNAWPVLAAVCDGVSLAHAKGILHRDLKPENILLLESGLPPCKILDFGLSRYTAKPDRITATGTVLGTPRYMAPEMLAENAPVDERADVFAIGAIAFEMLTGRSIYPAEDFGQLFGCILEGRTLSLRSLRPDAPPELDRVLADAVTRDVDKRIRNVDDLADRLARAIGVSDDRAIFLPAETGVRPQVARPVDITRDTVRETSTSPAHAPSLQPPPASLSSRAPIPVPSRAPTTRAVTPAPFVPATAPTPQTLPGPHAAGPRVPQGSFQAPPQPIAAASPSLEGRASYTGIAPPASFTRPEQAIRTEQLRAMPRSSSRPAWLWIALFLAAAIVTMLGAGALAYAVRLLLR